MICMKVIYVCTYNCVRLSPSLCNIRIKQLYMVENVTDGSGVIFKTNTVQESLIGVM